MERIPDGGREPIKGSKPNRINRVVTAYSEFGGGLTCTMQMIQRYVAKISGPLMDRIDIHIDVPAVRVRELSRPSRAESSSTVRERVVKARRAQLQCFIDDGIYANSQMTPRQIRKYCLLRQESQTILENAINRLGLSARAYDRVLKVSRTIADLEGSEHIESPRVSEAIQYRSLDRTYWK